MSWPGNSTKVADAAPYATPQWGLSVISDGGGEALGRDRHGRPLPPTYAEIHKNYSPSHATSTEATAQAQPHQLGHCFVVQQQPTTSVSAIHSWDERVLQLRDLESVKTAAAAAAVASGPVREWMPKPRVSPWCPPGLECLAALDSLTFFDLMLEISLGEDYRLRRNFTGRHLPRHFQVLNSEGQQVYRVDMRDSSVASQCETVFVDRTGEELITVKIRRVCCPSGYCGIACSSCTVDATVEAPPGHAVGSMTQRCSGGGKASFIVESADGSSFRLEESEHCCDCPWLTTNKSLTPYGKFSIYSLDQKQVIGKIEAQQTLITPYSWRLLTNFALSFPADLDVRIKATLSGAAAMLHYYYYGSQMLHLQTSKKRRGIKM